MFFDIPISDRQKETSWLQSAIHCKYCFQFSTFAQPQSTCLLLYLFQTLDRNSVTIWVCEKVAQNEAQLNFCQNYHVIFTSEKRSSKVWATSIIFPKTVSNHPCGRKFALSGVDVMITIFCDFWQFSAKKWRFSQKPMLWSKFCLI
jgi:hypothetical protein